MYRCDGKYSEKACRSGDPHSGYLHDAAPEIDILESRLPGFSDLATSRITFEWGFQTNARSRTRCAYVSDLRSE